MKKLLIIIAMLAAGAAHGQTRTGVYNKIQADHWKDGAESTSVIKRLKGTIKVGQAVILIDSAGVKPQAYDIVKRSNVQDYCYDDVPEHYGIQFLTVLYSTKTSRRVMDVVLLLGKDKRTIMDVIFKKSKTSNVTYTFD